MGENKPVALIVGGSSGLGLELALMLSSTHDVIVTGRRDPENEKVTFRTLDIKRSNELVHALDSLIETLPEIDLLIYAAGFYQEGSITEIEDVDIEHMINVGLLAPALLLNRLLKKQNTLPSFIAVTSTSQWTPRPLEPVYTAVKAGLGMLANSVSLDDRIGKVLVAAPAGMNTRFWEKTPRDTRTMLDPNWTAEAVLDHYTGDFRYKFIRILRTPPRVEVAETR